MPTLRTKSLDNIEHRMEGIEEGSVRYQVLQHAKNFKSSWIELGQALYTVYNDKLYRDWGYMTFDAYTQKEIGIKKPTAIKLLKSYYFLEKEEPRLVRRENDEEPTNAAVIPTYEAVNLLRLAKDNKKLDEETYKDFKKTVLDSGKDVKEVKKDLTALIKQREDIDPDEARKQKRSSTLKRLVSVLKSLKRDIETTKLLPASLLKETNALIHKIELELK